MPLPGPLKPWSFYLSQNFPYFPAPVSKIILLVGIDQNGGYGFIVNTDRSGDKMRKGGSVRFSPYVTRQARRNPAFLKCQALLTRNRQPSLKTASFVACDRLFGGSAQPLWPAMFDWEMYPATPATIQAVRRAVRACPALSRAEKKFILAFPAAPASQSGP